MVGIAALISVPFGILAAVFLAEFGPETATAAGVRFCRQGADRLAVDPGRRVRLRRRRAAHGRLLRLAGGVALAILMLPTVLLTAEEAIRMVPRKMREAAIGMGAHADAGRAGTSCCRPRCPAS